MINAFFDTSLVVGKTFVVDQTGALIKKHRLRNLTAIKTALVLAEIFEINKLPLSWTGTFPERMFR